MDLQHQFSILSRSQKITEGMNIRFIVSYVDVEENLLKLWIQPEPSMVQNLVAIMQSLRTRLEKSEGYLHQYQLTLNGFYCVKPTDSECWYRARVIKHAPNDGSFVIVHFIDYGHTGVIRVTNVKSFEEKLYSIPPQAVKCVMAEVASATGEAWHKEAAEYIRKILSQNEVTGNVVSKYLDIPYVRVFINGISLAHHLIEKGIGIPLTSGLEPQLTQMVIYNGETYRGLPLDINKDYFVYVSHIESPQKFYIQLAYNEHELNSLMEKISIHAIEQGFYPLEEILPGSPCISQFSEDNNFYRAVVTKVTPPTCQIIYIDYGNSESKSHFELKTIPQKFLAVPAQAKECKLSSNVVIDTDTFRLLVEDKLLSCHVKEQQSSSYVVTLHHNGENILHQTENSLITAYSQPLATQPFTYKSLDLHLNSTHKIIVTYIHSPVQFYCQLSQNTLHLKNLMASIATFCEMSNPEINSISLNECFPGKPLCCKYSADQQWYRAIVLSSIQNASIPVQFVDYGNEEITYISALKKINPESLEWPIQAIKCCLVNFEMFPLNILTSDSVISEMEKLVLNEQLVIKIEDKRNDIYLVSLYNTSSNSPVCINTQLQEIIQVSCLQSMNKQFQNNINVNNVICQNSINNCIPVSNDSGDRLYPVIPTGALEEVIISDASSPSSFFCQLQRESFELDTLMDELTEYYNGLCDDNERIDNFIVGMLCVARYSEDDNWYRAKVIDVLKSGVVEIFFVDYGNKEKTEKANVKKISTEFLNVSFKAIECSLANVDVENIQSEMIKNFQTLVLNNTFTAIFKGIELGVYKVELLDSEENNINEKFQTLPIDDSFAITNTRINSDEGWNENLISDENKNTTNLNEWTKNDNEWEESGKVNNSETNYYNSWNEEETERKFFSEKPYSSNWKKTKIDGNSERKYSKYEKSNNSLDDLDEKRNYNSQIKQNWNSNEQKSIKGKLKNKPIDHWQYGDQFVSEDESDVCLYSKKQSKSKKLVKHLKADHEYCSENLIDFKSIEIANGDFRYVNILNIVNPNEFYCQLVNDDNELLGMTEQISQFYENLNDCDFILENAKIGNPCCILSKNNIWCRGKIVDIIENNANVFYVDYGNSEIIPLKDIKILKSEFLKIAMQILKCSCQGIQAKESLWNEDDIKLFKDMTQNKYFLAQFLNKDKENTYLVNLLTVDALKEAIISKEFLKSGHGIKQSQESPQLKLPYPISYQTEVPNPVINIGEKLEITVTWVFTIEKFYCQLISFASQFEEIMVSIQKKYSEMLELEAVIEKPEVDSYCIAQFSEDNAWYRAKIVYVDGNKVGVRYIDYGNEEEVTRKKIKYILPQFALLPSQAVKCQMNDIKTFNNDCKISENLVQKYFVGKIICTFHSFIEDLYLVDLERDGKNISQLLIKDKLASPKNDFTHPTSTESPKLSYLKIDLSHRLNESMNILISYAESPYNFWCQLTNENDQLEEINNSLAMNYNELSENLLQFAVNTLCVAKYSEDNEWYRAVVKTCYSDQLEVTFIDYGNSDLVPLSQVKIIKSELSNIPAQSIECSLYGIPSFLSEEQQKEFVDLINGNEMKMIINEYNMDGVSLVTLIQNCEDTEINVAEKLFGKLTSGTVTEIFTSLPKPNDIVKGYVTTVNSISEFYLQLSCNEDSLSKLMVDLEEVYSSLSLEDLAMQTIIPNTACCAKFSEDNNWYRAVIKDVKGNEVTVYFIDYGNVDIVPRADIKVLKEEFLCKPSFSFKCCLEGVKPINEIWSNEAVDWFQTFIQDKTLDILFTDKSNSVVIFTEEGDVSKFLIENKFAFKVSESFEDNFADNKIDDGVKKISLNKNISLQLITKFNLSGQVHVVLSHIESANIFYVTLVNRTDELNSLQEELQNFYNNEYEDLKNIVLFQSCAAKFSLDEKWYRAEIIEISEKSVTVRFVDYGNSEILSEDNLKILHPKFLEFPSFASECSFSDLMANSEKLEEAKLLLENLLNDKELYIDVINNENQLFYISIISDTEKLCDQLVESGLYFENIGKQDIINYSYISIPLGSKTEVIITHALSPSEFWIQLFENRSKLDALMKSISEKYQEEDHQIVENFEIGKFCIASYSLDQSWYRAMITDVQNDNIELLYVDYGNKETVSKCNIREILPELKNIPIQAVKCALTAIYPDNKTLNEEICALFQEIVISDEKVFQAEFKNKQNDHYEVTLFDNGIDIKDILIQKESASANQNSLCENDDHFIEIPENIETENIYSNKISKNIEYHTLKDTSQETQMLQKELSVISEESINDDSQQNKYEFSTIEAMSTPLNKHKPEIKYTPEDISVVKTNDDLSYSHENDDTTMYMSAEDVNDKIKSRILPLKQLIENEFGNSINLSSNETQEKKSANIDLIPTFNDISSTESNIYSTIGDLIQTNDIDVENNSLLKATDISYKANEKYESKMKESSEKYEKKTIDDGISELFYEVKANEKSESETLASFESLEKFEDDKIINGISDISCEMETEGDYEIQDSTDVQDSFISLEKCDKYKGSNDRIDVNDMDPISQFPSVSNQNCIKEINFDEIQMNQSKTQECCSLNSYEESKNCCFQQTNILDNSETQGYIYEDFLISEQSENKIEADIGICLSRIKLSDIKDSDDENFASANLSSDISYKLNSEVLDFKSENEVESTKCYDNFKLKNVCLNDSVLTNLPDHKINKEENFDDKVCEQFQKTKFPVTNSKKNLSEDFDKCLSDISHSNRSELGKEYKETHGFCKSQEEKIVPGQISYVNLFDSDSSQNQNNDILKNSITAQDKDITTTMYSSDPIKRVRRSSMEEKIVPGQLSYTDEKSKVPGE